MKEIWREQGDKEAEINPNMKAKPPHLKDNLVKDPKRRVCVC